VAGISAYLLLRKKGGGVPQKTLALSLIFGFVASLAALFPTGHFHAQQVARTQREKFATIEGLVRGRTRAPAVVFGIPSDDPPELKYAIEIPGALSLMAHHDVDAYVPGIEDLREQGRSTPPFFLTFVSFHTMVGLGMTFIGLTALGILLLWRKKLHTARWYLRLLPFAIPLPLVACQLGWIVAEVGRQPWVVYDVLKTSEAFSPNVTGGEVLFSIVMFGLIYILLGWLFLFLLIRKVKKGPEEAPA
jgi:cytochrome d ubiquinol oxidase subunit I